MWVNGGLPSASLLKNDKKWQKKTFKKIKENLVQASKTQRCIFIVIITNCKNNNFIFSIYYFRGTYGGCFATTLGAMVHELGHTLDLGHTENGIMARGFDDMDRFFTICPQTGKKHALKKYDRFGLNTSITPVAVQFHEIFVTKMIN